MTTRMIRQQQQQQQPFLLPRRRSSHLKGRRNEDGVDRERSIFRRHPCLRRLLHRHHQHYLRTRAIGTRPLQLRERNARENGQRKNTSCARKPWRWWVDWATSFPVRTNSSRSTSVPVPPIKPERTAFDTRTNWTLIVESISSKVLLVVVLSIPTSIIPAPPPTILDQYPATRTKPNNSNEKPVPLRHYLLRQRQEEPGRRAAVAVVVP